MPEFSGDYRFGLKTLQKVRIPGDGIVDDLDGAQFVECDMASPIHRAHAANPDARQNLVLISDDHPGLEFVTALQGGLIRRTNVVIRGIGSVARRTIFHRSG
jgi:hypothetical protein